MEFFYPSMNNAKELAEKFVTLKKEFALQYNGNSHIQEILPTKLPTINEEHLEQLHKFARNNPIYHNSFEQTISNLPCITYEGDINAYWLDSIKHNLSSQPFYPTWILSAYIAALYAKNIGCRNLLDIGSGDGRIAYCGSILGLDSYSIEIDETLAKLQLDIIKATNVDFKCACKDAAKFDYSVIDANSVFFIGGLPQMGGDILAEIILKNILRINVKNIIFVLVGTYSKKNHSIKNGGWDTIINKYKLDVIDTILLPTVWTFDQKIDTPYIFAKLS